MPPKKSFESKNKSKEKAKEKQDSKTYNEMLAGSIAGINRLLGESYKDKDGKTIPSGVNSLSNDQMAHLMSLKDYLLGIQRGDEDMELERSVTERYMNQESRRYPDPPKAEAKPNNAPVIAAK